MTLTIFFFLLISFGYSLFEKLKDKKGYTLFLANHFRQKKTAALFWWFLILINSIITLLLILGVFSILFRTSFFPLIFIFKACAFAILVLLLGQRIAKDYQGAANLGIYMILTLLGWYFQYLQY